MGIPIEDENGNIVRVVTADQIAAASRDVEITIADIRELATRTLDQLQDDVRSKRSEFLGVTTGSAVFGGSPAGHAVASTHRAAHDVFAETVSAVIHDLQGFQTRLLDTIETYEASDASSEEIMLAMSQREQTETYTMGQREYEAYSAHQDDLEVPEDPDGPPPEMPDHGDQPSFDDAPPGDVVPPASEGEPVAPASQPDTPPDRQGF